MGIHFVTRPHKIRYSIFNIYLPHYKLLATKYILSKTKKIINTFFINFFKFFTYGRQLLLFTRIKKVVMKINSINYFAYKNAYSPKIKKEPVFSSDIIGRLDLLSDYLDYLGRAGRETVVFDDENLDPKEEINLEYDDIPKIDDLKLRRLDFLEKHNQKNLEGDLIQEPENFFINIEGYGRNYRWARYMKEACNYAALLIKNGESFEDVLDTIAQDCKNCAFLNVRTCGDIEKALCTGVLRDKEEPVTLATPYDMSGIKYGAYGLKYSTKALLASTNSVAKQFSAKTPEMFPDFRPTRIFFYPQRNEGKLFHPMNGVEPALRYSKEIYKNLLKNYTNRKLNKKDIKEVNSQIATIHWLMAHGVPYHRGSDSITNVFVKALYNALGFKLSGAKERISFDLEAFCSELDEYCKKYTQLYEQEPKYIL